GGCDRQDCRRGAAMTKKLLALTLGLSGGALAAALVLPVVAQESLLPEGFGTPAPAPAPAPTPAPSSGPAPKAPAAPKGPAPLVPSVAPTLPGTETAAADAEESEEEDGLSSRLKYDLPPGARRLLTRVGPLTP